MNRAANSQAKACGYRLAVSGPFGAIVFQVAATFRLRFGVRSDSEPHAQAKACGYRLAVSEVPRSRAAGHLIL